VLHNAAPCEQQRQQQSRLLLLQLLAATSQTFELQLALQRQEAETPQSCFPAQLAHSLAQRLSPSPGPAPTYQN
jgi:hypothetical protein